MSHTNTFQTQDFKHLNHKKIAIVVARFNQPVTEGLLEGSLKVLEENQFSKENYKVFKVPGSIEIPLIAQKIAKSKNYDAIICLGAVIRGDTAHFDYVCKYVTEGLLKINLKSDLPVAFGVIMTENQEQAVIRSSKDGHNKGGESALAVLEMLDLIEKNEEDLG
jgi:6,7-dimethyl-8-ribityllumazine synthase